MRPLTSAVPPCGGGGGRRPTAPPAGCSRLSAVAAAVTAAASTESGNPPALLVFCKTPPHSSSVRAGICLVGIFSGVNKNNYARANTSAYDLAGSQQSTNQSISCASYGTVQVAKNPSKDNTLHRKCATEGVVAEATRSAATVGRRQAAAMGTEGSAVKRKHAGAPVPSRPLQATTAGRCPQSSGDVLPLSLSGGCSSAAGTLLCGAGVLCLRGAVTRGGSGAGAGRLERGVRSSLAGERRSQETSTFVRGRASARIDRELAGWYVYVSYATGSSSAYNSRGHPHKGTKTHSEVPGCRSLPYIDPFWPSLGQLGTSQSADRAGQRLRNRPSQPKVERTQ